MIPEDKRKFMWDSFFTAETLFCMLAILLAFAVSLAATPLAGRLAAKCGCFDRPDSVRKLHKTPVPYFGGLAILVGFLVSALVFSFVMLGAIPQNVAVMFIGGMSICFVGLIDDMYDMPAPLKLLLQIVISAFTAYFGGAIEYTTIFDRTLVLGVFSIPVTVLWMVLIINALNLIDGLDGLASGVSALESFALLITSVIMGNTVCIVASAALCGAVLGFLPYNANRATIFMGDAGSMFIGYIMACISVFGLFKSQALFSIVVPALIFALPLLDTVVAFFRRIFKGQSPFKADRSHLHHKLIDNGFTPKQSVIAIYCASAVFCVASILFMKYKLFSMVLVLADFVFLEVLKHWKLFFYGKKKISEEISSVETPKKQADQ